ncbi:uncharacterized protein LOC34620856 [Cyclospora cayetanensis]|uniref:Uncharacterized protein LOC34620856 n=1 Tax=Cyclospora cayetanensis TaxID=88456 RepID=A0A6P6RST6_9EIME|nr:uncharacterized protein LOC34620856 [Cyclospora cayetanensis]
MASSYRLVPISILCTSLVTLALFRCVLSQCTRFVAFGPSAPVEGTDSSLTNATSLQEADGCKGAKAPMKKDAASLQQLDSFTRAATQSDPMTKVEQLLSSLRKRFDDVHAEVKRRGEEFARYKEGIRQADSAEHQITSDRDRVRQRTEELTQSLTALSKRVADAAHTKKTYLHVLQRTKQEKDMVRQKNLLLQSKLRALGLELKDGHRALEKQRTKKCRATCELNELEQGLARERLVREQGFKGIKEATVLKKAAVEKRYVRLAEWQKSVVANAAAVALSASSGKWRRMLCIEKLIANFLQKSNVNNVEKWQYTEDTFQKIREATGLVDVMEIVSKFLNRDSENQKLKQLAVEAERNLEALDAHAQSWNRGLHSYDARCSLPEHSLEGAEEAKRCAASINAKLMQLGLEGAYDFNADASLECYCQHLQEQSIPALFALLPDTKKQSQS